MVNLAGRNLTIKGGRVIDPAQGIDQVADVAVEDGRVVGIDKAAKGGEEIDAKGLIVCPGLIDMHVHLREPGNEEEETIASGSAAAVAGGFTSIACMPNTEPVIDTEAMVEFIYRQAARADLCHVYPIGAVTKGRDGKELAEMGQMVRAGAVAFSDDGCGVASPSAMLRALQYVRMFDKVIIQHCEDPDLAGSGCMNAGVTATRLGLPGIPAIAEEAMIARDLMLAKNADTRYHVAHISTAGAVQLVREAKGRGIKVTTEVCPHHLLLTEESVTTYDTNYKMNPPLRSQKDIDACLDGVVDGTIDCLITDHAPHGREEKEDDFQNAPMGIIGLEMSLGLFAKALVHSGRLDWPALIQRMTSKPATILGIPRGSLRDGAYADITIIDPDMEWTVDVDSLKSKSRNCPYHGWQLKGRAVMTIVDGVVKHSLMAATA